jgi:replicative DNA helicase
VQLNRERNDKAARQMPVLRDLRNTGAWEADARNVLFVHRREEVDRDTDLPVLYDDGVLQLAKVSNGRPDAERVFLNYGRMRFEELQTSADITTERAPAWP